MAKTQCPYCGSSLNVNLTKAGGAGWSNPGRDGWRPFESMEFSAPWQPDRTGPGRLEQAAAMGAHLSAYRKTPARSAEIGADVLVPILKGVTLGTAAAVLSVLPTILVPAWPWFSPLVIWLIITPASAAAWIFYHQGLLWNHERLDQEPPEAPPAPALAPPDIVANFRDAESDRPTQKRFTLPADVDDQKFFDFLSGVLSGGKSLARSDWVGKNKPLSRAQHSELIAELSRLHAIRPVDPAKPTMGNELTRMGKVLFSGWIEALATRQNDWD